MDGDTPARSIERGYRHPFLYVRILQRRRPEAQLETMMYQRPWYARARRRARAAGGVGGRGLAGLGPRRSPSPVPALGPSARRAPIFKDRFRGYLGAGGCGCACARVRKGKSSVMPIPTGYS